MSVIKEVFESTVVAFFMGAAGTAGYTTMILLIEKFSS